VTVFGRLTDLDPGVSKKDDRYREREVSVILEKELFNPLPLNHVILKRAVHRVENQHNFSRQRLVIFIDLLERSDGLRVAIIQELTGLPDLSVTCTSSVTLRSDRFVSRTLSGVRLTNPPLVCASTG
jgi:hypothetical protein